MNDIPYRQIRAVYDEDTIRVYQAFNHQIADAALTQGKFTSPPFSMTRMTWIKPSFLWMMYRAGWGYKDEGQSRILAMDISRSGFRWALEHSCPSHPDPEMDAQAWNRLKDNTPVRIQWDPERDLHHVPLAYRSIQIGLSKAAVDLYVNEWVQAITDVTSMAHSVHALVADGRLDEARERLPRERVFADIGSYSLA